MFGVYISLNLQETDKVSCHCPINKPRQNCKSSTIQQTQLLEFNFKLIAKINLSPTNKCVHPLEIRICYNDHLFLL